MRKAKMPSKTSWRESTSFLPWMERTIFFPSVQRIFSGDGLNFTLGNTSMICVQELVIREFSFHQLNANLLWPGTFAFAEWLVQHRPWLEGRCLLELGSGTGALAIFLHKLFNFDITTSDYDDPDIEENIAHNCTVNGVTPILPHIRHSWGDVFPTHYPDWDLVIASDILLYVKQYPNLIKTLSFLLNSYKPKASEKVPSDVGTKDSCPLPRPAFLMSWRRRIGKEDESLFFDGCDKAGLEVHHLGARVYCIAPGKMINKEIVDR